MSLMDAIFAQAMGGPSGGLPVVTISEESFMAALSAAGTDTRLNEEEQKMLEPALNRITPIVLIIGTVGAVVTYNAGAFSLILDGGEGHIFYSQAYPQGWKMNVKAL